MRHNNPFFSTAQIYNSSNVYICSCSPITSNEIQNESYKSDLLLSSDINPFIGFIPFLLLTQLPTSSAPLLCSLSSYNPLFLPLLHSYAIKFHYSCYRTHIGQSFFKTLTTNGVVHIYQPYNSSGSSNQISVKLTITVPKRHNSSGNPLLLSTLFTNFTLTLRNTLYSHK